MTPAENLARWLPAEKAKWQAEADSLNRFAPRFWSRVDVKRGTKQCWEWTGSRRPFGHGYFDSPAGRIASRFAWAVTNGRIPKPDEVVRHTCDNPPCCNPAHLLIGSQQDNVNDSYERGRARNEQGKCLRGHALDGDNVLTRPNGERRCKQCVREYQADYVPPRRKGECPICGKTLARDHNVQRHIQQVHEKGEQS